MHLFIILIESLSQYMLCTPNSVGVEMKRKRKGNQSKLEALMFLSIETCTGTSQPLFTASFDENTHRLIDVSILMRCYSSTQKKKLQFPNLVKIKPANPFRPALPTTETQTETNQVQTLFSLIKHYHIQ